MGFNSAFKALRGNNFSDNFFLFVKCKCSILLLHYEIYLCVILTWNATSFPLLQTLVSEKKEWRLTVGLLLVTSTYLKRVTILSEVCTHLTQQKILKWQVFSMFVLVRFISKILQFFLIKFGTGRVNWIVAENKLDLHLQINQPTRCISLSDWTGPTTTNDTATTTFQR